MTPMPFLFIFVCGFLDVAVGALNCQDCPNCAGTCHKTPDNFVCECPADKTGDDCDLCLIRPGWTNGGNGYQYFKTKTRANYDDTMKECREFGGHLAMYGIRDPVVLSRIGETKVFIGLTDRFSEGTFMWGDVINSEHTQTPWAPNQPSATTSDYDCGYLRDDSGSVLIYDNPCWATEFGLCEVPVGYPPAIPKFDPKNGCEYFLTPPGAYHVTDRICQEHGGKLAIQAVNTGSVLKKILYYFKVNGYTLDNDVITYTGFRKSGTSFVAGDGTALNTGSSAVDWKPGSPSDVTSTCLVSLLNPDWFDHAWIDDKSCDDIFHGLCEVCTVDPPLDQKTCKSGKVCSEDSICVIHEGSCFEECYCPTENTIIDEGETCSVNTCIGFDCGANAVCVFDKATEKRSCKCDKGYLPTGADGAGCYSTACDPSCVNAQCVINPVGGVLPNGKCECDANYMPHATENHECIDDQCATSGITCTKATCCIVDGATRAQGCVCDEGYYYKPSDSVCVDPLDGLASCGTNLIKVLNHLSTPPAGKCICKDNYLPEPAPSTDCFLDQCSSAGTTTCKDNAVCALVDPPTNLQGCVCLTGFYKDPSDTLNCLDLCKGITCPTNTHCIISRETGSPVARCICDTNHMPSVVPGAGCVADECANGNIACTTNEVCRILNVLTQAQGCVCEDGFYSVADICSTCPQTRYIFPGTPAVENYLLVDIDMPELTEFTICSKFKVTPGTAVGSGTLFSYATETYDNAIKIIFDDPESHTFAFLNDYDDTTNTASISLRTAGTVNIFHFCWVLSTTDTEVQLFVDGTHYVTRTLAGITSLPAGFGTIVIGQDQDEMGGGWTASTETFSGTIENLMMWSKKLTNTEISVLENNDCDCPSDVLFHLTPDVVTVKGSVTVDPDTDCVD
uniref:uncharacterized protein LOC120346894 n=1 Tax=Styela clava TaxID=7725 RepID=UPI00193AB2B7|nr:uncharacterized protein LOC120346894 [Styela clava]